MYIDVGTYISWSNESSVPFNSGTVQDLCGFAPGDHVSMGGCIHVTNGDGVVWTINTYNIIDPVNISGGGGMLTANVNIDEYAIGNAVSQGIINSGLGQVNLMSDNSAMHIIADKLQQILDKDKPKIKEPVIIPEVDDKYLIL